MRRIQTLKALTRLHTPSRVQQPSHDYTIEGPAPAIYIIGLRLWAHSAHCVGGKWTPSRERFGFK